jgi:hypothetical protein
MATQPYQMLPMVFRPGVNREQTQYTSESVGTSSPSFSVAGGWYTSQNVRFRQGFPEKIGGWYPQSFNTFQGICRSLFNWASLDGTSLIGVGTNLKFYINRGGQFYDITPVRGVATLTNPFTATASSSTISVAATSHGAVVGDFVTFSGATGLGGNITATVLNQQYQITAVTTNTFTFTATATANATDASGSPGGGTVTATYQINVGPAIEIPLTGWGAGTWNQPGTTWGFGGTSVSSIRLWSQSNFGQDLIFNPRGGAIYYESYAGGLNTPAVNISTLSGASDVPIVANFIFVSDASRFVFAFGTNALGTSNLDPMLVRWSDQESVTMWTPAATNQAGDIRLSRGSQIVSCVQNRQEIVVFTDTSVYSFQYVGTPGVWGSNIIGDNISILGQNAAVLAAGVTYWMGIDKFYKYSGTVTTLRCDLREYIFANINTQQLQQVFSGTNEGFNEVWWFYCSGTSTTINSYVVYNYQDDIWYYGQMGRTAWIDSTVLTYPIAATYNNTLVFHEYGLNDNTTGTDYPIDAYIESSEFDVQYGNTFAFINRILPDVTFRKSTTSNPQVTMTLTPLQNAGSGYNSPQSTGGTNTAIVTRTATAPIEQFTGQVFLRVRGRQMIFKIEGNQLGLQWQLGTPRIEFKQDGRRGNT